MALLTDNDLHLQSQHTLAFLFFRISNASRSAAQFKQRSCPQASIRISSGRHPHFVQDCGY